MIPKYIVVVATSLDGKIATSSTQKNWSSPEDQVHLRRMEDSCDVLVMGRNTFDVAQANLSLRRVIVLSRTIEKGNGNRNHIYFNPEKMDLFAYLSERQYRRVCVLGGKEVYSFFFEHNAMDELFITREPVTLGEGIAFSDTPVKDGFRLRSVTVLNYKGSRVEKYVK